MYVFGHRRSGNHLLIEYLNRFFDEPGIKRHMFHKENLDNAIYIARNGMDVMASCYEWWRSSGESRVCNIQKYFQNISFSEFLRGLAVPDYEPHPPGNVHPYEVRDGLFADPIRFWINHLVYYYDLGLPFIFYDKLLSHPGKILYKISDKFNLKLTREPEKITELVGCHPRKGIIGDHKNYFSDKDLDLFYEKVYYSRLNEIMGCEKEL